MGSETIGSQTIKTRIISDTIEYLYGSETGKEFITKKWN
jgi:hypothetical protein